jgi:hypothetical protein
MSRHSRARAFVRQTALIWAWLVGGGLGCHSKSQDAGEGRLSVRWTGPDTAAFSSRAVAEWCASLQLLEIRAVAGDTGTGIVLYPADTIVPGVYPVHLPGEADSTKRPSAVVALRWFSKTTIMGYQADSGRVTVERTPDGSLAGRFAVAARLLVAGARLAATGTFEDLRIVAAPVTCAGRGPGDTAGRDTTGADEAEPDTSD